MEFFHFCVLQILLLFWVCEKATTATQELRVTKCNATFEVGLTYAAVVYDGLDSVYILGGSTYWPGQWHSAIRKYSISTDTVETIGRLPKALTGGEASINAGDGSIYYFGGSSDNYDVYKFDILSSTVTTVETLPVSVHSGGKAVVDDGTTVLLFGGDGNGKIVEYDLNSNEGRVVADLPCTRAGGLWT